MTTAAAPAEPSRPGQPPDPVALGRSLVQAGEAAGVTLRLFGGVGIRLHCDRSATGERLPTVLRRPLWHVDVITAGRSVAAAVRVLAGAGLSPTGPLAALHGTEHQVFHSVADPSLRVDLVSRFRMCHEIDFSRRLMVESPSLPAADLLLTKLQIVQLTRKDVLDTTALLLTHEPAVEDGPDLVNTARLREATASDWGLYTTVTDNLARLAAHVREHLDPALADAVAGPAGRLLADLAAAPKTVAWRARARIGRSVRWYATPEPISDSVAPDGGLLPPTIGLGPLHVPAAYELVVDRLRRAIAVGDYLPGERLPAERTLADLLGVSRVTVQQAMRVLEGEGLLERRRGAAGGAFVVALGETAEAQHLRLRERIGEIEQELDFRAAVEPTCAALAAERRSLGDLALLEVSVAEMQASDGPARYRRADSSFHLGLAGASRNVHLRRSLEELRATTFWPTVLLPHDRLRDAAAGDHREILTAVQAGDPDSARRAMADHIDAVRDMFRGLAD
jgi:DNA-binding FadR family transcriptional regulator